MRGRCVLGSPGAFPALCQAPRALSRARLCVRVGQPRLCGWKGRGGVAGWLPARTARAAGPSGGSGSAKVTLGLEVSPFFLLKQREEQN